MTPNPEQQQAIERIGQDVCVVAGPGSGKTHVLTERFRWLVTNEGISPDHILTVTFTEKAAREIKGRLVEKLHDNPEIRQKVERAYVSTIHGFCTRLLRENAIAAGVDIGFEVLEESDAKRYLREATEAALDELLENQPDEARRLMESVGVHSRQSEMTVDLAGALIAAYGALRAAGDDWSVERPLPPATHFFGEVVSCLSDALADTAAWHTEKQKEYRGELLEWLEKATQALQRESAEEQLAVLGQLNIKLNRGPGSVKAELKKLRDELRPAVRADLSLQVFAPLRKLLFQALRRLDGLYRERKRAQSGLDFSDLEEHALRLLRESDGVRERVSEQFDYILMDELQDTNPLQWKILDCIRRPDYFFGVGDINQSIYGFRHAEPEVFRNYQQGLKERGLAVDQLVTNYRTRQDILDAVMWAVRDQNGIEPRPLISHQAEPRLEEPLTEIRVSLGVTKDQAVQREARWIASQIREFIAAGVPRKGIAVLGRKMRVLEPVADALREADIPSVTTGGQTLYETRETRDLLLVCNVLGNVQDEVSLAGLLRSPFVGCRDETLLRL